MDYTLCEYISPQFDALACSLAVDHLVEVFVSFIVVVLVISLLIISSNCDYSILIEI